MGYRETMFAKVLPGRLVGLKLIDTLSFGVNPGYLEARALFARVGTGGRGAVKGQIRGGFEVLLVVSEIKEFSSFRAGQQIGVDESRIDRLACHIPVAVAGRSLVPFAHLLDHTVSDQDEPFFDPLSRAYLKVGSNQGMQVHSLWFFTGEGEVFIACHQRKRDEYGQDDERQGIECHADKNAFPFGQGKP